MDMERSSRDPNHQNPKLTALPKTKPTTPRDGVLLVCYAIVTGAVGAMGVFRLVYAEVMVPLGYCRVAGATLWSPQLGLVTRGR